MQPKGEQLFNQIAIYIHHKIIHDKAFDKHDSHIITGLLIPYIDNMGKINYDGVYCRGGNLLLTNKQS